MKLPKYKYLFGGYDRQITVTNKNKERAAEIGQDARDGPKLLYGQDVQCGKGIDDLMEEPESIDCDNKGGYRINIAWEAVKGLDIELQEDRRKDENQESDGDDSLLQEELQEIPGEQHVDDYAVQMIDPKVTDLM